jgi:hypothetical protein
LNETLGALGLDPTGFGPAWEDFQTALHAHDLRRQDFSLKAVPKST